VAVKDMTNEQKEKAKARGRIELKTAPSGDGTHSGATLQTTIESSYESTTARSIAAGNVHRD